MVSVIIPTYNRGDRISASIESVLRQTYSDLELWIVDDGSSDNTKEVVEKFVQRDDRVHYICQENKGACAARNLGISMAKGDYIAFQDSDDVWHTDKLEKQLNALQKYNANVCSCKMNRFNYREGAAKVYPDLSGGVIPTKLLLEKSLVSTQTIVAERQVFQSHTFDENVKAKQDWDWVIRAAQDNVFCFADQALVDVYLQSDSITSKQDMQKELKILQYFYQKYHYLYESYPNMEVALLSAIAQNKTMQSSAYAEEFLKKYKITKSKKDLLRAFLSRICVLRTLILLKKRLHK